MDHILEFWDDQAKSHSTDHSASWGDLYMLEIERKLIADKLTINAPNNVLDAGTSNGHSLIEIAKKFPEIKFHGFDFAPTMVEMCNKLISASGVNNVDSAFCADIRNLESITAKFDFIFTTRVLINLPTWSEQMVAIDQLLSKLETGGTLMLMEGFWEPLTRINSLRALASLPPLREHDFNRYLKHENVHSFLIEKGFDFKVVDFSSTYYLFTRFLREVIGADKLDGGYTSDFNLDAKIFHEKFKDTGKKSFGIQQAYLITK